MQSRQKRHIIKEELDKSSDKQGIHCVVSGKKHCDDGAFVIQCRYLRSFVFYFLLF